MIGMVSRVASLVMLGIGVASFSSGAGPPDALMSTVPPALIVGGKQINNPAQPDPVIRYVVTVHDAGNVPVAGAAVVIDFTNCTDTHLCSFNLPGHVVDCISHTVSATTDAAGEFAFSILGAAMIPNPPNPPDCAPGAGFGCAEISANGIPLGTATVIIYDLDGAAPPLGVGPAFRNGVKGSDVPIMWTDWSGAQFSYRGRVDYWTDGQINGLDFSKYLAILGYANSGDGSANGCADDVAQAFPYCP